MDTNKYKKLLPVVIILVLAGVLFMLYSPEGKKEKVTTKETTSVSTLGQRDEDILQHSLAILNALGSYYLASNTFPDETNEDPYSAVLFSFMEQNRFIAQGSNFVASCSKDSNEIVQLACGGIILGGTQITTANNTLLNFLRNLDLGDPKLSQETSFRLAENISAQKEGYKNVYVYAPQIGYLYFKGATSDNPTGPIPYLLTKEERDILIKEIDSRFGDYIKEDEINYKKTGNHNAVLGAVKQIKSYIVDDNYPQK